MPLSVPLPARVSFRAFLGLTLLILPMCGEEKKEPDKKSVVQEEDSSSKADANYIPDPRRAAAKKDPDADKKTAEKPGKRKSKHPEEEAEPPARAPLTPAQIAAAAKRIEDFTGSHTKLVWNETENLKHADPFSFTDGQFLRVLDTRDGKGERTLFEGADPDNYSRPLISPDGAAIVYTRRTYERQGGAIWAVKLEMFRTDWSGSTPVSLGKGYALNLWRDPATSKIWVYAGTDVPPQEERTFNFNKMVRFPLDAPDKVEVVWTDSTLSPENIQLSRDGQSLSALLPWPNAGVLRTEDGHLVPHKLTTGCWPSQSPDNSYVFWVFDGNHGGATFFSGDGTKSWDIPFNNAPQLHHAEVYHPRWTNHPLFFVLTGPYASTTGPAIGKNTVGAQVQLGRFSPNLDKIEEVLQITEGSLGEGFPDAWIEGGDKVDLAGFTKPTGKMVSPSGASAWPSHPEGLVFLWTDRSSLNRFTGPDGKPHASTVQLLGAARSGRFNEICLDGGSVDLAPGSAALVTAAWQGKPEAGFEALVIPSESSEGSLFHAPGLNLWITKQHLNIVTASQGGCTVAAPLPGQPFHLAVNQSAHGIEVWVNGKPMETSPLPGDPPPDDETVSFGRGSGCGIMRMALFGRALSVEEVAADAFQEMELASHFPPAPARVKVSAKLVEAAPVPSLESIQPYTSALVECVYEVEKVESGDLKDKRILVKHWGLLNRKPTAAFPREVGKTYELTIERESDHAHLKGERVSEASALDLEPWIDVTTPEVK